MNAKQSTAPAEQMDADELSFWRGCFRTALADCLDIKRTPEFCAQIAAETADSSVREYRKRLRGESAISAKSHSARKR